jgi:hypothetical protein
VSCRRSPFAPQGPFVSKDDPGFRPGRIIKKKHVVEARMHERDRWKRASTARRRTPGPNLEHAPPHAKWLRSAMKELSAVLAVVLAALEADRWPDNAGAGLSRRREVALDRLQAAESSKPLGPAGQRLHLLLDELGALLVRLSARKDSPSAYVDSLRAAAKALEECSRDIESLLADGDRQPPARSPGQA